MIESAAQILPTVADAPPAKLTSTDIKLAIKRSFEAPAYQTFFEVSNDTGLRIKTYADAVTVGIWPSTGHEVHGFEVKVSRGDFLNEMKNPGKSLPIYKHCHRWSLAAPAGMVKPDELPVTWGLFELKDGTLRNRKQPALLAPEPLTPGFLAALVRRAGEDDAAAIGAAVRAAKAEWEKRLEEEVDRRIRDKHEFRDGATKLIDAIRQSFGDRLHHYDVEQIVRAVKVARDLNFAESWSGPVNILAVVEDSAERMRTAMVEAGIEVPARKKGGKK
jgi:hypothetical protein